MYRSVSGVIGLTLHDGRHREHNLNIEVFAGVSFESDARSNAQRVKGPAPNGTCIKFPSKVLA